MIRHKLGVHRDESAPRRYVCDHDGCTYATDVLENFRGHTQGHGPATFVCHLCGSAFKHRQTSFL